MLLLKLRNSNSRLYELACCEGRELLWERLTSPLGARTPRYRYDKDGQGNHQGVPEEFAIKQVAVVLEEPENGERIDPFE